jgi:hypothetical protein
VSVHEQIGQAIEGARNNGQSMDRIIADALGAITNGFNQGDEAEETVLEQLLESLDEFGRMQLVVDAIERIVDLHALDRIAAVLLERVKATRPREAQ